MLSSAQAQDILLFPESTFEPSEPLFASTCMSQCNAMMTVLKEEDNRSMIDKIKSKLNKLADLHENPTDNMLVNINRKARQLIYLGKHEMAVKVLKKIVSTQQNRYGTNSSQYADAMI